MRIQLICSHAIVAVQKNHAAFCLHSHVRDPESPSAEKKG